MLNIQFYRKNGIVYPVDPNKDKAYTCEKAAWEDFMGNNHNCITGITSRWGGQVSIRQHLGKPLSNELWMDLVGRIGIRRMRIYQWDESQWCMCVGKPGVDIHLDKDNNVCDLSFDL